MIPTLLIFAVSVVVELLAILHFSSLNKSCKTFGTRAAS
jgi:hypothetical protein